MPKTHYIAEGAERGSCGHKHRTGLAALRCAYADDRRVVSAYAARHGSVHHFNGMPVSSDRAVVEHCLLDGCDCRAGSKP